MRTNKLNLQTFIVIILLSALSLTSYSQSNRSGLTKMKRTGATLAGFGVGVTTMGIIFISTVDWEKRKSYSGYTSYNTTDPNATYGIIGLSVGMSMMITGIILNTVAKVKMDNVRIGYFQHAEQKGLKLSIRF